MTEPEGVLVKLDRLPYLDEVHDYENVQPIYQIKDTPLLVRTQRTEEGSGLEFEILGRDLVVLQAPTVVAMDHFKGQIVDAATAHQLAQWIRDNVRPEG